MYPEGLNRYVVLNHLPIYRYSFTVCMSPCEVFLTAGLVGDGHWANAER